MKQANYLRLMGIDRWRERRLNTTVGPIEASSRPADGKATAAAQKIAVHGGDACFTWQEKSTLLADLQQRVANCTACRLHKTRTQTVFGIGHPQASLMLIGEAPGFQEDQNGEPFFGEAGKLLNTILLAVQLKREDVYITNVLKSRPPENRVPQPDEIAACTPFLLEEIALIKPKLLVALGRIAIQYLLQTQTPLSKLRGEVFYYGKQKIPLITTYHPAYLLRKPEDKRKAWEDWQQIKTQLEAAC